MVKLYVGSNFGNNKFGICGGASCDHAGNDAAAADDDDVAVAVAADDDGGGKLLHAVLVTISLPSQYFFSAGPHHGSWPNSVSVQNAIDLQPTLRLQWKGCCVSMERLLRPSTFANVGINVRMSTRRVQMYKCMIVVGASIIYFSHPHTPYLFGILKASRTKLYQLFPVGTRAACLMIRTFACPMHCNHGRNASEKAQRTCGHC